MATDATKLKESPTGSYYSMPIGDLYFVDSRIGDANQADPQSSFAIDDHTGNTVSRNHCEVYVIVYEDTINHVYVRDRKSVNGTYVNGKLVGVGPDISPGYLLQNGDVVEIRPYWKFKFTHHTRPMDAVLTDTQVQEASLFKHKYQLTSRCLGKGAEASVYLATDTTTKKQLVCKVVDLKKLKLEERSGRERRIRLMQETDILRQLQHPNILPYIDAISSPYTLYTFTALASGGDLMSFLFRHNPVMEFDARLIIRQVVHGLAYLHAKGIVHRDIKPENILLAYSPRIAYHRVMLADFGASAVPRRSRMVTMLGTPDYQAPEFLSQDKTHTTAADMWSLGVIAYILAAVNERDGAALGKHSQSTLDEVLEESFAKRDPPVSAHTRSFIKGCLQVSCEERMTITDAERHDWLCKPKKHLDFFRRFDKRMMADWQLETHLKPMPLELQSLRDALDRPGFSDEDIREEVEKPDTEDHAPEHAGQVSDYFAKPEIPPYRKSTPKVLSMAAPMTKKVVGVYQYFAKPESPEDRNKEMDLAQVPPRTQPAPASPTAAMPRPRSVFIKHSKAPPKAATQLTPQLSSPSAPNARSQPSDEVLPWKVPKKSRFTYKSTRRCSPKSQQKFRAAKFNHGHFALPISGLERRLPHTSGGPKRELVLDEVHKTNRPFLKNSEASSHGISSPSNFRARTEPNSKRRRTRPEE